jgi:hypothetical protein
VNFVFASRQRPSVSGALIVTGRKNGGTSLRRVRFVVAKTRRERKKLSGHDAHSLNTGGQNILTPEPTPPKPVKWGACRSRALCLRCQPNTHTETDLIAMSSLAQPVRGSQQVNVRLEPIRDIAKNVRDG